MLSLKPLQKSLAVPVLQFVRGFSLTKVADEALFSRATTMSEGEVVPLENGENAYYGTTFVTIGLIADEIDLQLSGNEEQQLIDALECSVLFRLRLMRLARKEAEQRCVPFLPVEMVIETEFRIEEKALLIDINVECPLAVSTGRVDSREEGEQ
jgi:hypothetical protein